MVGDSASDIMTARAVGVPIVAVDFGYTEIPVTRLDPDRIISGFDELPAAVQAVLSRTAGARGATIPADPAR
jgi:phosphoglycolate phosphatase